MGGSVNSLINPIQSATNSILGGGGSSGGLGGAVNSILGIQTPSAPTSNDYLNAAQATAAGNLAAAREAVYANRANQWTPYGTLTWQKGARLNDQKHQPPAKVPKIG